jgi:hypothetical protein
VCPVADLKLQKRIMGIGIRNTARETKIHTDTVTLIARGKGVKPSTFAKVVRFLDTQSEALASSYDF